MSINNAINYKKENLLAYKAKLLEDIKYYEKRIENFPADKSSKAYCGASYSSDSEDDFPSYIDSTPSVPQLKLQQASLRTCLQATQELTSLQVLQSEANLMVDDPVLNGEPAVTEPGSWREVIAECRIDLVPFSIMFYVHTPNRTFGAKSYRCLKVLPGKSTHEVELSQSILTYVSRPSDAVEVLRSYATAYRSRRSTLARLADKYARNLFMEPMAEGGYLLKCANLLEMSWRLENKSSPVADFHHRMKFELEYMDESYVKIITQAHKQLSNPAITTDERTLLLAKIISICLEAQGHTQELHESMESDPESVKKLDKRRTTLDQEEPVAKKKKEDRRKENEADKLEDNQIMAPPKSLPKKVKTTNKDVIENRKSVKRTQVEEPGTTKKAKIDESQSKNDRMTNQGDAKKKTDAVIQENDNPNEILDENVVTDKNKAVSNEKPKVVDKRPNQSEENNIEVKKVRNKPTTGNKVQNKEKHVQESTNTKDVKEKSNKKLSGKEIGQNVASKEKIVTAKAPQSKEKDDKVKSASSTKMSKGQNIGGQGGSKETVLASSKNNLAINTVDKVVSKIPSNINLKTKETEVKKIASKEKATISKNDAKTEAKKANQPTKDGKTIVKKTAEIQNNDNTKNLKPKNSNENQINSKKDNENAKEKNDNKLINKPKTVSNKESNNKPKSNIQTTKTVNKENLNQNINSKANTEKVVPKNKQTDKQNTKNFETQKNSTEKLKPVASKKKPDNAPNKYVNHRSSFSKEQNTKQNSVEKVVKVNNVNIRNKEHIADRQLKIVVEKIGDKPKKSENKIVIKNLSHKNPSAQIKLRSSSGNTEKNLKTGNNKMFKAANIGKENSDVKISKIPQLTSISESAMNKNYLRISPRKLMATSKSTSDLNKPITNIPRLMKKPVPKSINK